MSKLTPTSPIQDRLLTLRLAGEDCQLHPHAALFWSKKQTLIIADLHLGKATHFRRHGMAVPDYVKHETLDKLSGLLLDFKPKRCLMLGDVFHSDYNAEWDDFADVVTSHRDTRFVVIPGNHDRLSRYRFEKHGIELMGEGALEAPFCFTHHPYAREQYPAGYYNLAGHVHPAVLLEGGGERLKLPCFYFGEHSGLLPAFGSFTGTHTVRPRGGDRVFVLAGDRVLSVQS